MLKNAIALGFLVLTGVSAVAAEEAPKEAQEAVPDADQGDKMPEEKAAN